MVKWVIFYSDGSSFSSKDGSPDDAPALDIQVIAQGDETVGRKLLIHKDYYWYESDRWYGGELFGLYDYLIRSRRAKFGRYVTDATYAAAVKAAMDDPRLPVKSAVHGSEREHDLKV